MPCHELGNFFVILLYNHDATDTADACSIQDACHI